MKRINNICLPWVVTLFTIVYFVWFESVDSFNVRPLYFTNLHFQNRHGRQYEYILQSNSMGGDDVEGNFNKHISSREDDVQELKFFRERQIQEAIMEKIFVSQGSSSVSAPSISSPLMSLSIVGQAAIPLANSGNKYTSTAMAPSATMLVLLPEQDDKLVKASSSTPYNSNTGKNALLVPLTNPDSQLRLLSFAYTGEPIQSLTILLSINTLLVNRDNALFDNLPWSTWSKDPKRRNRDAAGNPIDEKIHLGKRDAYNRFMGKDWPGRSLALGNLARRLKYMTTKLETDGEIEDNVNSGTDNFSSDNPDNQIILLNRVLQLRIRELQMDMAEIDSQLAIARNNPTEFTGQGRKRLERKRTELQQSLQESENDLLVLLNERKKMADLASSSWVLQSSDLIAGIFERMDGWSNKADDKIEEAPYRGALGYAPILDSREEVEMATSYRSPFDLLKEILYDQLNAKVVGCALENTSLLRGNLVLGGAVVLQRLSPIKRAEIAGEIVECQDDDEDYGNKGIKGGEIMVVECDVDEAIGVALAYGLPLKVEQSIFEAASVAVNPPIEEGTSADARRDDLGHRTKRLPVWEAVDSSMSLQMEGDAHNPEKVSPISFPRTTTSLFDSMFTLKAQPNDKYLTSAYSMFPTDNPIKSLEQLDRLSDEEKAKTLLEMSNFSGTLPRPRVVRRAPREKNPLDALLLPLIDETVRNQYRLRDAERRGDVYLVNEIKNSKSKRQVAREMADEARLKGDEDIANKWEEEAIFLESLRADVTQDEGAYSRFLDRDSWYESDRKRTAKRTKRSSFGNLLDEIE